MFLSISGIRMQLKSILDLPVADEKLCRPHQKPLDLDAGEQDVEEEGVLADHRQTDAPTLLKERDTDEG
jgi:hypothetical protein